MDSTIRSLMTLAAFAASSASSGGRTRRRARTASRTTALMPLRRGETSEPVHFRILGRLHRHRQRGVDRRLRGVPQDAERAQGLRGPARDRRELPRQATSGTRTSPSTTTRCRAGGAGCSTSRSSSPWSTWSSIPDWGAGAGTLGWTQVGQLEQENARAQARFGPLYEKFAAMDVKALAEQSAGARHRRRSSSSTIARNATRRTRGGSRGFPNLTDRDWLWGGDPVAIRTTITDGRTGIMPPFGPALGEGGTKDVAHYVMSLSGGAHDSIRKARGEVVFKHDLRRLPRRRRQGQPGARRAQPHRQDLAARRGRADDHPDHHAGAHEPDARAQESPHRAADPPADRLRLVALRATRVTE